MLKLMIVEDEELLRMGLVTCVDWADLGYEIIGEAGDGEKALKLVEQNPPDVIITDIKMPRLNGIDMAEKLKADYPGIRIVVISGYDEFEYARRALKMGVSEYILKPINLEQLKKTVVELRMEIEEERKKDREFMELKSMRYEDMQALRQQMYTKLLLQKCSVEELGDYIGRLGEPVLDRYYGAGILAIEGFPVISMECDYLHVIDMDRSLEDFVNRTLKGLYGEDGQNGLTVLRANAGERILCICGESPGEVKQEGRRVREAFGTFNEETGPVELFFGTISRGLEGLHQSYLNVRKDSEVRFMKSLAAPDSSGSAFSSFDLPEFDKENLFFEIKSGSSQGIEDALRELQDTLSGRQVLSYMQLVLIITNLYGECIRLPEEAGGNAEEILGDPRQYYQRILEKKKRNDMIEELGRACFLIHAYFEKISGSRYKGIMERAAQYVEEHYSEEGLSMGDVAAYAHVSVSYLGMIIKNETGQTFIEYLTGIRIEKAKYFLKHTNMKNYEVAIACGYATPSYFSTVFKGMCGMTPSEYRNG